MISSPRFESSESAFLIVHSILVWDPQNAIPGPADMLRPSMQTLEHIVLLIEVDGVDVDPLYGIPSELEDMRSKNIIETITIYIYIPRYKKCRRDDWGTLDKVLTYPGWPSLMQVSLSIEIATPNRFGSDRPEDDVLEKALRNLPETQFPQLSSSNSVSFNFEIIING